LSSREWEPVLVVLREWDALPVWGLTFEQGNRFNSVGCNSNEHGEEKRDR